MAIGSPVCSRSCVRYHSIAAAIVTKSVSGDVVDPRAGRVTLATVYKSWLASRLDLSPKVRRGYEDIWRPRIEPRFGGWSVGKIDHPSIQKWVNEMAEVGRSPRTLRWIHSVLKMCLDHAADEGQLLGRNPSARTKFPPLRPTAHTYLTTAEVAALTLACGRQQRHHVALAPHRPPSLSMRIAS